MKKEVKIILIISCLIVFAGILALIFFKHQGLISNKPNESETKVIDIISKTFMSYSYCQTGKAFEFKDNKAYIDQFSDENIIHIAFNYLHNMALIDRIGVEDNKSTYSFKQEDFIAAIKTLFGEEVYNSRNITGDLNIRGTEFKLENGEYKGSLFTNACIHLDTTNYKYLGYTTGKDNLKITYLLYYATHIKEGDLINTYLKTARDKDSICKENELENNEKEFNKYNFVFVKTNGNFIFDHIELIK